MSGKSARHYWTDAQLIEDARFNRGEQDEYLRRARTEWDPSESLREANTAKLRAEASEAILRSRRLNEEQVARSGVIDASL